MDRNKKKLILVTRHYPYFSGEGIFLQTELKELVMHYQLTILSTEPEQHRKECYDNQYKDCVSFLFYDREKRQNPYKRFFSIIKDFLSITFLREFVHILSSGEKIKARTVQSLFFYRESKRFYKWLKKNNILNKKEAILYYTYWNHYYTLAVLKRKKQYKDIKVVSRFHGDDLYNERHPERWQPFKRYMDRRIDKCLFVSEAGRSYYMEKFAHPSSMEENKYETCKIGTKKRQIRNPDKQEGAFCLVSCSAIIPLKRVDLIVKALSLLKQEKLEWIHFGAGEIEEQVKQLAKELLNKKENITYKFMGYCDNEEIMKFYERKHVDCFITTSSTEGLPVSVQEALSVGIPIIGTAVGGIPECIDGNGILMSAEPQTKEIAESIQQLYYMEIEQMQKLRENSYDLFQREYNGEVNAKKLVEVLDAL